MMERVTMTLSLASTQSETGVGTGAFSSSGRERAESEGTNATVAALSGTSSSKSAGSATSAPFTPPSLAVLVPSSSLSAMTRDILRDDEGCIHLSSSPFVSLLLFTVTALLLLQLLLLCFLDPRRVSRVHFRSS
jgi:hypothetical protein